MNILKRIINNKRNKYILVFSISILLLLIIGVSFAAYTSTNNKLIANITINELSFNLTTNNGESDDRILHLKAGQTEEFEIILTNLNKISAKYELIYSLCNNQTCNQTNDTIPSEVEIYRAAETIDDLHGSIKVGPEYKKSITLRTINNSSGDYYIKLDLNAGYDWNDLELTNLDVNDMEGTLQGIEVLAYVDGNEISIQSIPNTCNYVASIQAFIDNTPINGNFLYLDCDRNTNRWRIHLDGLERIPTRIIMNFEALAFPAITYTGEYEFIEDDDLNWRIKFKTSGTLTFDSLGNAVSGIDVFCVGGGAGGRTARQEDMGGGGGGGGYTEVGLRKNVNADESYEIIIGEGGKSDLGGENTTAFGVTANGGDVSSATYAGLRSTGGKGGSGGGGGGYFPGNGGSDGSNGSDGPKGYGPGGTGRGTTTREFHEPSGQLYAGGGAGGKTTQGTATGGAGGGANSATAADRNTGGGGSGGTCGSKLGSGYAGGSGIVVIRNQR